MMMHSINETLIEMSKSDKKLKKRKHEESSPASQDGSDESVVEELLKQYETYKTQFEEWTTKNKGNVSQEAYDKYVDDFRSWEKIVLGQIKSATKKHKSKKKDKKRLKGDKAPRDQVEVQDAPTATQLRMPDATAAPLDPLAMMMTMAMMMMPAMMQQQQQQTVAPPVVAAPPQVFQVQQALPPQMMPPPPRPQPPFPPAMLAGGGAPSFLVQQPRNPLPAPAAVKSVALPDLSKPPPIVLAPRMAPPPSSAASTSITATPNFSESRRPTTIDYGHGAAGATQEYDDYWYRKNQERLRNEAAAKPNAPPRPLPPPSIVRPTPPSMPFAPPPQRPFRPAGPQTTHRQRAPITGPPLPLFPKLSARVRDNDRNGISSSTSPNRQSMPPPMNNNNKPPQHRLGARDFSMRRHV